VPIELSGQLVRGFLVSGVTSPEYHRAISEPGKQYALYIHHSSEKISSAYTVVAGEYQEDLVIHLPAGHYRADWVDPATSSVLGSVDILHEGGHRTLTPPHVQGGYRASTEEYLIRPGGLVCDECC